MSKNKNTVLEVLAEALSNAGAKISLSDAAEITKVVAENTEHKFLDLPYEDKMLRVEGDVLAVDAVISWVDAEGVLSELEDGEYAVEGQGTIVVASSIITEIKPEEEAEEEEVVEEFNAEESMKAMKAELDAFKELITNKFSEQVKLEDIKAELSADFAEQIKSIPAMTAESVKADFSTGGKTVANPFVSTRKS